VTGLYILATANLLATLFLAVDLAALKHAIAWADPRKLKVIKGGKGR